MKVNNITKIISIQSYMTSAIILYYQDLNVIHKSSKKVLTIKSIILFCSIRIYNTFNITSAGLQLLLHPL